MKKLLLLFLLCILVPGLNAQELSGDKIQTSDGDLVIHPIVHGTLAMQWNDLVIYNDPYGGAEKFAGIPEADLVLITDIHGDHFNLETLEAISISRATIIVPQAVADMMPVKFSGQLKVIGNGDKVEVNGVSIEALPMYNLPETEDSRHPKGRGNGYVLTMGGKKVYISGDTEDIAEMRALENIDVAFVCMNLPYTMDVDQAASAVLDFKPVIVYPFHYRGKEGLSDVDKFKELVSADRSIEVRLRKWYD